MAQQSVTISGYMKDKATGEVLVGATLFIPTTQKGASSNEYGFYSLTLPKGEYDIKVSYLGYDQKEIHLVLDGNLTLDIAMTPSSVQVQEVVVSQEKKDQNVKSTDMGKMELTGERIKTLPVIFGESDVLKAITLLPGIKSGGEGNTGFYVRGGGPDQNLILMDEAVVYNPAHLLGFLSVFNTDAIRSTEIIKGAMPARYGGRLSSILNVNMREGNNEKFVVTGGIGAISSRIGLEGPVKKGVSSFIISGRVTYLDRIIQPFLKENQKGNGFYFYDFNFKWNYVLGKKDKIFFSSYIGRDVFNFKNPRNPDIAFNATWGNSIATLRWNHVFSPKVFANTSLIYNRYDLTSSFHFITNDFKASSGIRDWNLKTDFEYFPNARHKIRAGYNYTWHTFVPGSASGSVTNFAFAQKINKQYAHELGLYVQDDFALTDKLAFNLGLRYVLFDQVGPYTKQEVNEFGEKTGASQTWGPQESIAFYDGLEPRLAATYLLGKTSSIKASYTKTHQFLHLATTSGATFPTDLWIPSSQLVKPQIAHQFALGYFRNFKENTYETSVEAYYKPMRNLIEFKPGAVLFLNQNLENEIILGKGEAYGIEFFVKKKLGRLNGWIGYTLSKTTRQFDQLNGGKPYPYRYDRRHDVSVVISYEVNKSWSANFVFVYGTGIAVTLPTSRFVYEVGVDQKTFEPQYTIVNKYDQINNYRLPAYHRADISMVYARPTDKRFKSSWVFSIYNVYNRKNPYFIYFEPDPQTQTVKAYMVYLFPILPSITWNFRF
jgi:hypothetical protein